VRPRVIQNLAFGVQGILTETYVGMSEFVKQGDALAEVDESLHLEAIEKSAVNMQIQDIRKRQREIDAASFEQSLNSARSAYTSAENAYNANRSSDNLNARNSALSRFQQAEMNRDLFNLNTILFNTDYERFSYAHEQVVAGLEKCLMTAPVDGQILHDALLSAGDQAEPRTTVFSFVSAEDTLLHITSRAAMNLRGQDKITIIIDGKDYEAYTYEPGRGDAVWSANIPINQVFLAFVNAPDLLVDSNVSALIIIEKANVLVVPRRSIRSFGGVTTIDVMDGDEIISVPVQIGIISGDLVEVISGLSEGDVVVVG